VLPASGEAKAKSIPPTSSSWRIERVLQIGNQADDFTLPGSDGETVSLSRFMGKKNVLVTTDCAHW